MPALNEELSIEAAVENAKIALDGRVSEYEVLLFNDGSGDHTGEIMERLASADSRIRVIHHDRPRNLGGVYKHGIELAEYEYLIMIPGDNENPTYATIPVIEAIGRADVIVPYVMNHHQRPIHRRVGSKGYTVLMNYAFGLSVRYFNGTVVHRTEMLRQIDVKTDSFAYQAEILVKVLRRGATTYEVGVRIDPYTPARRSSALSKKNLLAVGQCIANLAWDVHGPKARGKG